MPSSLYSIGLATKFVSVETLRDIQSALQDPHWKVVVLEEMNALTRNEHRIVDLPKDKTAVGCKWVFTAKYKSDGTSERYKARLVTQHFSWTFGIDYDETFAQVIKKNSMKVLPSLAANLYWEQTPNGLQKCLSK